MMQTVVSSLLWFCAVGCALLGGLYFAFSAFIMTALASVDQAGIVAMNAINRLILRSWFMPFFVGTTLAGAALAVIGLVNLSDPRAVYLITGGSLHVIGMFLVTMFFNVPLNNVLAAGSGEAPASIAIWNDYRRRWTGWNHVRTLSCMGASVLFILALQ